jgi:hypothetical protein
MNRLILFATIVFLASGCKNAPVDYTILGDYTPYNRYPEKIAGRVKELIENNYWAIPQGGTFIKGNKMTVRERDSLPWTNDFTALFDDKGRLISCTLNDENNKTLSRWELSSNDKNQTIAKYITNDTVRNYRKLNFDDKGNLTEILQYSSGIDTLLSRCSLKTSLTRDTTELWWYNNKGALISKHIFIFYGERQFFRTEAYDHEGVFRAAVEAQYNNKGKVSELIFYDRNKEIIGENYITYEYDNMGNWVKAIVKNQNGKVVVEERVYTYLE